MGVWALRLVILRVAVSLLGLPLLPLGGLQSVADRQTEGGSEGGKSWAFNPRRRRSLIKWWLVMLQESEFNSFALIIQSVNVSPTPEVLLVFLALSLLSENGGRLPRSLEKPEEEIHPRCPD